MKRKGRSVSSGTEIGNWTTILLVGCHFIIELRTVPGRYVWYVRCCTVHHTKCPGPAGSIIVTVKTYIIGTIILLYVAIRQLRHATRLRAYQPTTKATHACRVVEKNILHFKMPSTVILVHCKLHIPCRTTSTRTDYQHYDTRTPTGTVPVRYYMSMEITVDILNVQRSLSLETPQTTQNQPVHPYQETPSRLSFSTSITL